MRPDASLAHMAHLVHDAEINTTVEKNLDAVHESVLRSDGDRGATLLTTSVTPASYLVTDGRVGAAVEQQADAPRRV